ncbi:hypothetical protein SAICODRAFT_71401 [Saitoella complicata NRRL Y-17804]|uniref:Type 1 phosphatases regulator n=1 Tax=Saitoella complicata (strain BCRC 22490 / CBS 7301 / JCM 7358 / NBRC 10748 / NRRL Y-17804) TaxID=698492 RepID=A0A0E9NH88_SAICN|nr:uncharacterized protein SAICODRAFT_71401 [Saitoella complicata NRRL Y-17804]ODQ52991.1 hypothetical protein SAICODRAFT_71401 [Saitoella complicata NRRL Y-17804]GAO49041.1 hypothetical protein G7K_3202-t1 [Saitoella complicata NRRL Y-17804]
MQRVRPSAATGGSSTVTTAPASREGSTQPDPQLPPAGTLVLRGANVTMGRRVQWDEDVVDNEGLGRKSSKVCCIFHKQRAFGESSSESSSSDSSSSENSDSDNDDGAARPPRRTPRPHRHEHEHNHGDDGEDDHDEGCLHEHEGTNGKGKERRRKKRESSPNAYEKMPKYKPRGIVPASGSG